MKNQFTVLLITILSFNSYAQTSFEKGYFISNGDEKTECLILNIDWKNNPTEFEYKLSDDLEVKTATIRNIKEFGILEKTKYNRFTVNIDRSSEFISSMSTDRNPIFNEETLFLQVLVEGKANLYLYEDGSLRRYFYKTENTSIEQLIYKSYLSDSGDVGKNNKFKRQLWVNLKCPNISEKSIENIDYNKSELVNFFIKYNKCYDSDFTDYDKKGKKDLFNLTIRPGLNSSSLTIENGVSSSKNATFDNELSFRFGVELEFVMPFNNNKWALIIEPTYQYYKSEKKTSTNSVNVDYKSIELPIGIRHYFFLNDDSKLFLNASFVLDFAGNSTIDFSNGSDIKISSRSNLALGFGYNYNKKYSLELRYGFNREILGEYVSWNSEYKSLSIIIGYTIF